MDSQLLVRMYNVGLGDCIYLKVPDQNKDVHILIDCGNKFSDLDLLGQHIGELSAELPDAGGGKKRLDLLVVTHPHEDHHKGFEEEFFDDLKIERIWLSPAYDHMNPKAQGFHALQGAAQRALESLSELALGDDLKAEVAELLSLTKDQAIKMLTTTLPHNNEIEPLYASADTPQDQLDIFDDPAIRLKVLGPMSDIDHYYLGGDGLQNSTSGLNSQGLADEYAALFQSPGTIEVQFPRNIGSQDFKLLRDRVNPYALAAAEIAGHATNNLSVVLLLEWHGLRLLFPGDAEWKKAFKGQFKVGRTNGSWNVMWHERKEELSQPLDFLKIGHHGSENATPWTGVKSKKGEEHPINQILDQLLPLPEGNKKPTAKAVVSTERTSRWPTIPDPDLMVELGKRVANARNKYVEDPERKHVPADTPQPQRTDLEAQITETPEEPVPYIEIEFSAS
jgi:beta-lactamase superfamily II metal-dependent hydrolase